MAKCANCSSKIWLGGAKWASLDFCDEACEQKLKAYFVLQIFPLPELQQMIEEVHSGQCPVCKGLGPVDVCCSYKVSGVMCCQRCARRRKLKAGIHCLVFGWWSPKALGSNVFYAPYNLFGAAFARSASRPSRDLETAIVSWLADQNMAAIQNAVKEEWKKVPNKTM
jgi:hypothetical protein